MNEDKLLGIMCLLVMFELALFTVDVITWVAM